MIKKQAGFTLVEIALVLIIIGLLLGSVLKAQELIINAKVKNLEEDYKEILVAIYSYQDRYGALPGDDRQASRRFPKTQLSSSVASITNGNGNGQISGQFDDDSESPDRTKESRHLWAHLRLAGFIRGDPGSTTLPIHPFDGVMGVSSQATLEGRIPITISGNFVGFTHIPNHIAIILESRIDDNEPHLGQIQTEEFNYQDASIWHKMYFAL